MKHLKNLARLLAILGLPFWVISCEKQSALEEAVEEVGDEIDDATTD